MTCDIGTLCPCEQSQLNTYRKAIFLTVFCWHASLESVWALLKRGYHGVFHHFSDKHIGRYVDEFVFRLFQKE
jgi:hypothetical protein